MNAKLVIRQQVHDFIAALAPVPRRKLWAGIKGFADGKGDVISA